MTAIKQKLWYICMIF